MIINTSVVTAVSLGGAVALLRIRSYPKDTKDIVPLFFAIVIGVACGSGYYGVAVITTIVMCAVMLVLSITRFGIPKATNMLLKITIPEDLDYTGAFEDIFAEYTKKNELVKVKTTNMGSMFRLTYNVTLRDATKEKEMIDRIRERNGNLEIMVSKQENRTAEL